jgi:serine/threonine protein kinase
MIVQLKNVFKEFNDSTELVAYQELASGHINDTYLVTTSNKNNFVLQRINQGVFKDIPGLINNKVAISNHIQAKLSYLTKSKRDRKVLTFVHTKKGTPFYYDKSGGYWNMMVYISNSKTHETVKDVEIAFEGGKLIGDFLNLTSDFDAKQLIEVIPKFHDMSFRFSQFEDSLKVASKERLENAEKYIDLIWRLKDEMHIIQQLKESGKIPLRVTHNDTKISNVLFDNNNKGLCVIDTDTIMPGVVHYDFGDAIRTICNSAAEDETDLTKVNFNPDYYKAYLKGFLGEVGASLSPTEIKYLPLGAKTMIFIMALRFLTDYLNGDIYYKIKYPEHNLDRAKNQFKLIESMSEKISI